MTQLDNTTTLTARHQFFISVIQPDFEYAASTFVPTMSAAQKNGFNYSALEWFASSLTQLGVQSRTCTKESLFDDDDVKSFSKEISQAIREGLRRSLSKSVQASDPTASPPRKEPPKPWR